MSVSEQLRLDTLRSLNILDTLPEKVYDDLVKLAAAICGTSIAALSLVDQNRQWFKSIVGLDVTETSRDVAFCDYTIRSEDVLHIPDTFEDDRFKSNPLVIDNPNIRFYAGAPLIFSNGAHLGALCVIDTKPHLLNDVQKDALQILAKQVITHLEFSEKVRALKESETRLIEQQRFMDLISNNLPGVIYRAVQHEGTSFRFQYMSRGAEGLFGLPVEDIIGKATFSKESVHPSHRDSFVTSIEGSIRDARPFQWEGVIQKPKGLSGWIRVSAMPAQTDEGVVWYGIILDINQEKLLATEVTSQQDKVAEASKLLSFVRLATGLAREISNPLAVIKGLAVLLENSQGEEALSESETHEMIKSISSSSQRIEQIVNHLEGLSSSGPSESFSSLALSQIVRSALSASASQIAEAGLEVELNIPAILLKRCQPAALSQAMREILVNGCETKYEKKPKLKVTATHLKGWVQLRFEDSGIGVARENIGQIFDPFFTTKQVGAGRGIGLSRARALVETQGGTLTYDSSSFKSSFVLTLPQADLMEEG